MKCECKNNRLDLLVLRVMLGLVMLPHGLQKTFGLFGGGGFSKTMEAMTSMGLPSVIVFLVIMAESVGAVMLILGILPRFAAFGIACVMIGAIFTVHLNYGFFMNWYGTQAGEGFEYHLLAIGMAFAIMLGGGGKCCLFDYCCIMGKGSCMIGGGCKK